MVPHSTKLSRAESARINGAKSRGPKTPEGIFRSQTASYKHGLYAVRNYKLPGESNDEYAEFQAQLRQYWQPKGFYDETLVEELVGILWESKRLHAAKNDHIHDQVAAVTRSAPNSATRPKSTSPPKSKSPSPAAKSNGSTPVSPISPANATASSTSF